MENKTKLLPRLNCCSIIVALFGLPTKRELSAYLNLN